MSKLFTLINTDRVDFNPKQKIIRQNQFSSLIDIQELLQQAQLEIEQLRSKTSDECARLKEEAKEEGFQKGLESLNEQILSFDQAKKQLFHEMNSHLLSLALKAAKKIVAQQLKLHPETIVDIVLQTLIPVFQSRQITIYVNQEDKDLLETKKPELKQKLESVESLVIQARDDISQGGCIIETEGGIVNATIENQWDALEEAFNKYLKPSN